MKKALFYLIVLFLLQNVAKSQQLVTFNLASKMDGVYELANGSTTNIWGYDFYFTDPYSANIDLPSPTLRVQNGDTVIINFFNASPEDHTIHLHGLDVDQNNDGVPSTSFSVLSNQSASYEFVANHSGTFLYHCHVLTTLHLTMGMYGAIVVEDNAVQYTTDHLLLASDMDVSWNNNPTSPGSFNLFRADYFMINGASGQQLSSSRNVIEAQQNDTLLLRFANIGYSMAQYTLPANIEAQALLSDGRFLPQPFSFNSIDVYPGERYDVLLVADSAFDDFILVEYFDLAGNELIGENRVPTTINLLQNTAENEKIDDNSGFSVYPNPGRNRITVESKYLESEIKITSIDGKEVVPKIIASNKWVEISVSHLSSGVYLIHQKSPEGNLIIERLLIH